MGIKNNFFHFEFESPFFIKCWIPYNNQNRLNYDSVKTYKSQWLKIRKVHFLHCMSISGWHISLSPGDAGWQILAIWSLVPVAWDRNIANYVLALPDCVAQCVGRCPPNWKVTGAIPSEGTCLGQAPVEEVYERQPIDVSVSHWCFSFSLSPSLPISLKISK